MTSEHLKLRLASVFFAVAAIFLHFLNATPHHCVIHDVAVNIAKEERMSAGPPA